MMRRGSLCVLIVAVLLGLTLSPVVRAIIIRHDIGYTRYEASEADYPAVFYLHREHGRRICVATLIHSRWAVTAAHCTHETPLGEHIDNGETWPVEIAGRQVSVEAYQLHPAYPEPLQPDEPYVDLALLRFSSTPQLPRPLPLYRGEDEAGRVATLLGWGYSGIGTQGRQVDDGQLRFAHNRITEATKRLRLVFDDPRELDSRVLEFEGFPGRGDSGGPALLEVDGSLRIAGVLVGEVASAQRASQGLYGAEAVYERISRHQRWIDETIGNGD